MDEKTIFLLETIVKLSDEYESRERFLGCLLMALEELRCSEPEISRILSYTRNNIMTVTPEKAASHYRKAAFFVFPDTATQTTPKVV